MPANAHNIMNFRNRIQQQVFRLNGLSLNEFDLSQPPGDPGLFGPDHVIWRVHGDFPSMLCGGISALMLQMLHPAALAGVWIIRRSDRICWVGYVVPASLLR